MAVQTDVRTPPRPGRLSDAGLSVDPRLPHLPALDGLRGVAVAGVLLYHAGFSWARGGFLGVSTFFTLSGFLITALLLNEHRRHGRIELANFWARRLRRLMPAALAGLLLATGYAWLLATPDQLHRLRGDVLAALLDVANWRFAFTGQTYGDLTAGPSPVLHYWSLSIEEQFYLVFPILLLLALRAGGRRLVGAALVVLTLMSVAACVTVAGSETGYYGTQVRAAELLIGALLALAWTRPGGIRSHPVVGVAGAGALLATVAAWHVVTLDSSLLSHGGLALHAVLVALVLLAATQRGPVRTALSWRPLRWLGLISYGVYIYHWPVFLLLSEQRTHLATAPLFAGRLAATLALAVLSYHLLERPVRRRIWLRRPRLALIAAPAGALAVAAAVVAATLSVPPSQLAYASAKLAPRPTSVENLPAPVRPKPTPSPTAVAAPARVMFVGDSVMYDELPALKSAFAAAGTRTVIDASTFGFGLTNSTVNWRATWPSLVAAQRPDLVVVLLGPWDVSYVQSHGRKAYDGVVNDAVRTLTASGARVLWLGMLPSSAMPQRPVNPTYAALPAKFPGRVSYWELDPVLRGPKGDYPRALVAPNGTPVLIRKPDTEHLCPEGAARIADSVLNRLVALHWSAGAGESWRNGAWRSDPRYDNPAGGCAG